VKLPIRVLLYSRTFAPALGGIQTFVMHLARGLSTGGLGLTTARIDVTVVTKTRGAGYPDAALPFRVARQPSLWQLVRLLREADVVHLAGATLLPLLLARMCGKRVVVEHHGFQPVCPNGQMMHRPSELPCPGHFAAGHHLECWRCNAADGWLDSLKLWVLTFLRQRLCHQVQANIVPTTWLGTILQLPRQTTIHHAVSLPRYARPAPAAVGVPTFAFVGRLVSTKGVPVLLEAAARLRERGREFRLVIVGDGPERARLEALVRKRNLHSLVHFRGALLEAEKEDALAGVTAVVLPSLGGEVFGLAAAESMLCGRAVVASSLGSLSEVVGDAGLVFSPGNAEELADCLERFWEDPSLAGQLSARARDRAARLFGEQRMLEDHARLYRSLVGA